MYDDIEWQKGALVTTNNGDTLHLAVQDYDEGTVGIGFADGMAFAFYNDDEGRPYSLKELMSVLKNSYGALKGDDNDLYAVVDDERFVLVCTEAGLSEDAGVVGLSEEDLADIEHRLEAVADEYWGFLEIDA